MRRNLFFTMLSIKIAFKASLAALCLVPLASTSHAYDLSTNLDQLSDAPEGFFKKELLQTISNQHWQQVENFLNKSTNYPDARSFTLKECIDFAFANNPEIKQQLSDLESSRDRLTAATRSWNPTASISSESFTINGGESFNDRREETDPSQSNPLGTIRRSRTTDTTNSRATSRVQAEVTWQFLDFSRQPTINSASASYSAQRYGFYLFSRDLVSQIQTTYYQLLAQKDLITSYTIIAKSQKLSAEVQRARFDAGRVSLQDLGQSYAAY